MAGENLPGLIDRAATMLASAKTAAEVLEAREAAGLAYDVAKRAARLKNAKAAHDDLVAAAHRAQADALEIEAAAKRRLADEYDAAQERGDVAGHGGGRNFKVGDPNVEMQSDGPNRVGGDNAIVTMADLGLRRDQVHDARLIRDAEAADPGIGAPHPGSNASSAGRSRPALRSAARQRIGCNVLSIGCSASRKASSASRKIARRR